MTRTRTLVALALLQALVAAPAPGTAGTAGAEAPAPFAEGAWDGDEARVEARLLVHPDAEPAVRVGLLLEMDPGWHVYWRNPGETGLPTRPRFSVEGGSAGPVAWPAPARFAEADGTLTTFGYEGRVLLTSELTLGDAPGAANERRVAVEVELLACERQCIPASFSLERPLRPPELRDERERVRALFRHQAETVPRSPDALGLELETRRLGGAGSALRPGDVFAAAVGVRGTGPVEAAFFPDVLAGVELETGGFERDPEDPDLHWLALRGRAFEAASAERLRGVLSLRGPAGARHVEVDLPLVTPRVTPRPSTAGPLAATPPRQAGLPLAMLGLAFLGGLVLNLMPCVLPVLAIKLCALAELAHRRRREVIAHGLAYAAGIGVTMLALAGVVIGLRAAGHSVGWGFQFQEPLFIAGVSAVLVVFAMNLLGVFEIRMDPGRLASLGSQAVGARRSFFEGLLAVVLATPCSAPFLGTAAGFALASSGPAIVAVFLAIGAGLAAPFLLLCLVPGWGRALPRSGGWMLRLRGALAFALLGTVVWLLWVAGRSVGVEGVVALLGLLWGVALVTATFGAFQERGAAWLPWAAGLALVGVAFVGFQAVGAAGARGPDDSRIAASGLGARALPFDPAAAAALAAEGRPAFVYFTADWCITCKVNETLVLDDPRVRAELDRLDVTVFRADWTRRDDAIRAELARHGKAGVPLYLIHHPGDPDGPTVLPELLTVDGLIEALRAAPDRVAER